MMKLKDMNAILLACGLLLGCGGAAAQSSASATLPLWRYVLTDLAPQDGIAPSITLAPQSTSPAYLSIAWHGRPMEEGQDWQGPSDETGAPVLWQDGGNSASAWSLPAAIETAVRSEGTPVLAHGLRAFSFVLSPHTRVAFFQDGHLAASGLVGVPGARGLLALTLGSGQDAIVVRDEAELVRDGLRDFTLYGEAATQGESLAGTIAVQGTSYVLVAVPEPEQYLLWLGGLALLGACRRFRPGNQ